MPFHTILAQSISLSCIHLQSSRITTTQLGSCDEREMRKHNESTPFSMQSIPLASSICLKCFLISASTNVIVRADHRLQIEYTEALPLREFYEIIDEHFQRRQDLERFSESLNCAAHQYRVVEKRLLSRFRDRNPSPLDKLDVVSEETYTRLVQLGEQVENAQKRLDISAKDLGCAAGLVALLARYRFQLSSKDHTLLLAHLFPNVTDTDDQVGQTVDLDWILLYDDTKGKSYFRCWTSPSI